MQAVVELGASRIGLWVVLAALCIGLTGAAPPRSSEPGEGREPADASQSRARLEAGERPAEIGVESAGYRQARVAAPRRFAVHQSRNFVALSDGTAAQVRGYLALLERAKDQFDRFAAKMELDARPLKHKLVCLLFREPKDYRAFATQVDHVSSDWIWGYYSPENDWIVFCVDGERNEQISATILHEAIHQLVFHTGVQSRKVRYPLWICEGLATCFESEAPEAAFGPGHEYEPRRKRFSRLLSDGKLLPLRELVVIDQLEAEDDDERIDAIYQQSYALVMWMHRFRAPQLREYLQLMRAQAAGRIPASRHVQIFEQAFGEVEDLERAWLRHEAGRSAGADRRVRHGASQR